MKSGDDIFGIVMNGIIGMIVISSVLGWAKAHDPGGPFSFIFDPLGTIAMLLLDPSLTALMFAAGVVMVALGGDEF